MRPMNGQNTFQISDNVGIQDVVKFSKFERARGSTFRKPKGELDPLARLKITESLSDGARIGVEILSDPTSIT